MNHISGETIFVTAELEATSGTTELAVKLASRANLPGADDVYVQQYNQLFTTEQYSEAAKITANSEGAYNPGWHNIS